MKKTVLVTGGSRGIGAETVKVFAKNGFTVYLNYNKSFESAEALKNQLTKDGFDVHLLKADVANPDEVEKMLSTIHRFSKHLDVLVNNAGVSLTCQVEDATLADFENVVNVNQKGVFLVTKHALPLLRKNAAGSIVNISSIWGLSGASCESLYSMTKAAIIGFSLSLSKEFANSGIAVNCVCPSLVLTDMCKNLSKTDIAAFEKEVGKVSSAEAVAGKVFSVATDGKSGRVVDLREAF